MLLDRSVCGINDNIQRRLLSEDKLSFKRALEVARVQETATKNAQALRGVAQTGEIRKSQAKEAIVNPSQVLPVWEKQPLC